MTTNKPKLGVLLTNLGTPDAPTYSAVRRYLKQFLSDPRIVSGLPMWLWKLILNGVILQIRPQLSAKSYQKVWTEQGSPLLAISLAQQQAMQKSLESRLPDYEVQVVLGMRYGSPSIASALQQLPMQSINQLLVLPLYPQYASASSASGFDAVADYFRQQHFIPRLQFINDYHQNPLYIEALATSVREHWQQQGKDGQLLMSFHGMPQRLIDEGDPYAQQCEVTAKLLAQALDLKENQWQLVYQSRFGREAWLTPNIDSVLQHLGKQKAEKVAVICAGFSADCLETLEEINQDNRAVFLQAGGQQFHYIPALNTDKQHIKALTQIIIDCL